MNVFIKQTKLIKDKINQLANVETSLPDCGFI
jgi:hypothetical protein